MANVTGALVAVELENGSLLTMQSKHGGNIFNMGRVLLTKYKDKDKAKELVEHGGILFLKMLSVEVLRVRIEPMTLDDEGQLLGLARSMGFSNTYLFKENKWFYYIANNKKFMPLVELLPKN